MQTDTPLAATLRASVERERLIKLRAEMKKTIHECAVQEVSAARRVREAEEDFKALHRRREAAQAELDSFERRYAVQLAGA